MAPPPKSEDDVFLDRLAEFHEQRGTPFDRDPKVAGRPINLLTLYRAVIREGGYDVLSAERMRWRALTKEFGLGNHHEAAMTFQLKTIYYRYLTSFEIKDYWSEDPPPPEIVEHLTAKGGDVRKRTLENYQTNRESQLAESDEEKTPRKDVEAEDSGSTGRYPSRLRQDPKRTQLFQPPTLSRQASPAPATSSAHSSDPRSSSFVIDKFTPKTGMAMALRSVPAQSNTTIPPPQKKPRPYEPQHSLKYVSSGLTRGPNIYIRCLYGLRSGIAEEQDFALHHLVKVSFERGDKYRFEGFPQLAEALLEKALEVSMLVHGIKWTVSYDENAGLHDGDVLNGLFGTPGLFEKLQPIVDDSLETAESAHTRTKLNEAALVIRNMSMLEENAVFISRLALLKDYLIIALNLPEGWAEMKQYALDTAEQVTKYWELDCSSPIYKSLTKFIWSQDRGAILTACRAISRIGMDGPAASFLTNIPISTVHTLISNLLLEDDELMLASLDILYQYIALPQNQILLCEDPATVQSLISRLVTLLLHNAQPVEQKLRIRSEKPPKHISTVQVVPDDLYNQLLTYPEPERSTNWLKCCFEEVPNVDITQIAIWKAYQNRFLKNNPIVASDFIKNVSLTFSSAQAQVINGPDQRFIIRGIRPKQIVTDPTGQPFWRCRWQGCDQWLRNPEKLWIHNLEVHLKISRNEDGKFQSATNSYQCQWDSCSRHEENSQAIGKHMLVHMPTGKTVHRIQPPEFVDHFTYYTAVDEKGPSGIPYMAVLVLKNFARFALRHQQTSPGDETLMQTLFDGVKLQLWKVFGMNKVLRADMDHLLQIISQGSAPPRRQRRSAGQGDV